MGGKSSKKTKEKQEQNKLNEKKEDRNDSVVQNANEESKTYLLEVKDGKKSLNLISMTLPPENNSPFPKDIICLIFSFVDDFKDQINLLQVCKYWFFLASQQFDFSTALRWAAQTGHYKAVRFLLAIPPVDPSQTNTEIFKYARQNSHWKVVELLLAYGNVEPNEWDTIMVLAAVKRGFVTLPLNVQIVEV